MMGSVVASSGGGKCALGHLPFSKARYVALAVLPYLFPSLIIRCQFETILDEESTDFQIQNGHWLTRLVAEEVLRKMWCCGAEWLFVDPPLSYGKYL
jgi:hypothetical protein